MEIIVSHVNRRWRAIALDLPALWTSFRFTGGDATLPVGRLSTYLERSGSYPLDFWFDLRDMDQPLVPCGEDCINFILQTVPHVARWRRFSILLDLYGSFEFISLHFKELCATNLEYFALVPIQHEEEEHVEVSSGGPDVGIEPQIFSGGASKLTSVFLDTLSYGSLCMPPLSNVTTLTLLRYDTVGDIITPDVLYSILALPQLTNLAFVGEVCEEGINRHIDMPNLRNLRLGNEATAPSLLLNLQAPLLETLTICSMDLDFTDSYRITDIDVPSDQFPSLHTLSLVDVQFRTSSVESRLILRLLTKGIKHLVVSISGENNDDDPPEDEGGYLWTALDTVSFNVKKPVDPKSYRYIRSEIQGDQITLQLHQNLLSSWRKDHQEFLEQLQRTYTLVPMDDGHPLRVTSLSTQGEGPGGLGDINDPFYLDFLPASW